MAAGRRTGATSRPVRWRRSKDGHGTTKAPELIRGLVDDRSRPPDSAPMGGRREVLRNRAAVASCWAASAFFLVMIPVDVATSSHRTIGDLASLTTIDAVAAAFFYRGTRTRIELGDSDLLVYTLFATRHIARVDVADVAVDYGGLHMGRRDGTVVTVATMGKPNWSTWLKREAAADRWARRIAAWAHAQRQLG
jgi:hypothetical protein